MKILLIHNYYRSSSPSGEDIVFKNEVELLKKKGIQVVTFEKHNDEIRNKFKVAFNTIWSMGTYKKLKEILKKEKPDIVHFHNIWYLISPSAYYACKDLGIPVVQTLHNFRFFCINGLLMRNGSVCEECIGKFPWRGIKYGCYRNSKIFSIPIALSDSLHKLLNTLEKNIDAFISLTYFAKRKFIECGLPEEKIFIKPNFLVEDPNPNYENGGYALFVGRLSREKGIMTLLKAWKDINGLSLKIVGDGPMKNDVVEYIEKHKLKNIHLSGRLSHNDVIDCMKKSMFVIFPSECYEGFPMTIAESYACGKPVVASNLGAMAELVEDGKTGLLFKPGNPGDLAEKIQWMIKNEDACVQMGKNARRVFEEKYTADKNFEILIGIYEKVIRHG